MLVTLAHNSSASEYTRHYKCVVHVVPPEEKVWLMYAKPFCFVAPNPTYVVVNNPEFGTEPMSVYCPYCQTQVTTKTTYESGLLTWISCTGIFICG